MGLNLFVMPLDTGLAKTRTKSEAAGVGVVTSADDILVAFLQITPQDSGGCLPQAGSRRETWCHK